MTREEIEQIVAAEVDRRVGGMVGQIGKDLEERYATKAQVDEQIEARMRREALQMQASLAHAAKAIERGEKLPDDHPFAFLVTLMEDIVDLQMRTMELGIYVVADHRKDKASSRRDGVGSLDEVMKFLKLKDFVAGREIDRLHDTLEEAERRDGGAMEIVKQIVEILGPRPEKKG